MHRDAGVETHPQLVQVLAELIALKRLVRDGGDAVLGRDEMVS